MSSDNQFTALGPAIIGFQTHGTRIDIGADVTGTQGGLSAKAAPSGGQLAAGVRGETVRGSGVVGSSQDGTGVEGNGTEVGVHGTAFDRGGVGVWGQGREGSGGRFEAKAEGTLIGQISLVPQEMRAEPMPLEDVTPRAWADARSLPGRASVGDILLTYDTRQEVATLWICVRGLIGDEGPRAQWRQVLLGERFINGQA